MARKREFTSIQKNEIRRELAKVKKGQTDVKAYDRLMALQMYSLGKTNNEIHEVVGFSAQYVMDLVTKYINGGMEVIVTDKRTSNNRRMSFDEETAFLEQFVEPAQAGQILTANAILQKFEEHTGKPSNAVTIHKLLKRHGWRKVKPRPCHPGKATDEDIESSKKLSLFTGNSYWKKM
jgi:transposase